MSIVTDERLMAYADGALPAEEARALEIMIAEDPALAARLTPFAMTGAPLAEVFDTIAAEPIPDRLVKAIAGHSAATARASRTRTEEVTSAPRSEGFAARLARALGLEASGGLAFANAFAVAGLVVAGGIAGYSLADHNAVQLAAFTAGTHGELLASGALASALETRPNSDEAGTDGVVTRSAFVAKDASGDRTYCREYRLTESRAARAYGGVACRGADGAWRIANHTALAKSPTPQTNSYGTASGADNAAIEATIGALIEGDLLTPEQESAARARGWK